MDIELRPVKIRELTEGYSDNGDGGVIGYGGKLDIRPPYQREFIYKPAQRDLVIDTVRKGFPLNVMYWAVRDDGGYEVIDGQQRTISIAQYVAGEFTFDKKFIHNLPQDQKDQILDYEVTVYLCSGTDSEKLDWFRTINIAGEKLTEQELRNAVYHGSWVTDAKKYFSKTSGPAYGVGGPYLSGTAIRQDYLETAIEWINGGDVEGYMAIHQHDASAAPLWQHFNAVITWVKSTFPTYRDLMKGIEWGPLYNRYKDATMDPAALEAKISELITDDEVTAKKGIYSYLLTGEERHLNLRAFDDKTKQATYERQQGVCPVCGDKFALADMEADHIVPWSKGGKTAPDNCQMLCRKDNNLKGNK